MRRRTFFFFLSCPLEVLGPSWRLNLERGDMDFARRDWLLLLLKPEELNSGNYAVKLGVSYVSTPVKIFRLFFFFFLTFKSKCSTSFVSCLVLCLSLFSLWVGKDKWRTEEDKQVIISKKSWFYCQTISWPVLHSIHKKRLIYKKKNIHSVFYFWLLSIKRLLFLRSITCIISQICWFRPVFHSVPNLLKCVGLPIT